MRSERMDLCPVIRAHKTIIVCFLWSMFICFFVSSRAASSSLASIPIEQNDEGFFIIKTVITSNGVSKEVPLYFDTGSPKAVIRGCAANTRQRIESEALTRGVNNPCVDLPDTKKTNEQRYYLDIDGERVQSLIFTLSGEFGVTLKSQNPLEASISANVTSVNDLCFSTTMSEYWDGTAGSLGLSHPTIDNVFKSLMKSIGSSSVVLSKEKLEFYGAWKSVEEDYPTMRRGMSQLLKTPMDHRFPLFDFKICGDSIMFNNSAAWPTIIDSGTRCLGLPYEFYVSIRQHVDLECQSVKRVNPEQSEDPLFDPMCRLAKSRFKGQNILPSLYFRVSDDEDEPLLRIPLSSLIRNDGTICMYYRSRFTPLYDSMSTVSYYTLPVISFGTMVLQEFQTLLSYENGLVRVGFGQNIVKNRGVDAIKTGEDSSNALCKSPPKCKGSQWFYPPYNQCLEPDCSHLFFRHYDKETGSCQIPIGVTILTAIVVAGFVILEFFFRVFVEHLEKGLVAEVEHNSQNTPLRPEDRRSARSA
eukprot:TRINITY_DN1702_c0_g1_i2.p1 TRINITY_DN1702_c0_g1~~TRINITY_DN1702_c0_g1_i2.p1  ORF type:complete len:529 (-),score=86.55 TRINITY_DN1702_c0_g1_i2:505-2091(-)